MSLEDSSESFRLRINMLAKTANKLPRTIYGWWKEYEKICISCDQSPCLPEFENWYHDKMAS